MTIIRDDLVPLVSGRTGDEGHDRFGFTHVEDFMRHAWLDVDEVAGFVLQHLLEPRAKFMAHPSLQDVKDDLEIHVNVGLRDPARWNSCDVRGERSGSDIFRRHALFVVDPVPIPSRAAAANGQDASMIFNRAELNVIFVH